MAQPTFTSLLTERSLNNQNAYTSSASITPTSNRLAVVGVFSTQASGTVPVPTVTGGGVATWSQVATYLSSNSLRRVSVFAGLTGSSPGTAQLAFDFGGNTQNDYAFSAVEVDSSSLEGTNGVDTIARYIGDQSGSNAATFTLTFTGDWAHADNLFLAFFGIPGNRTIGASAGFDTVSTTSNSDISLGCVSGRSADLQTITAEFTGTNAAWFAVGVEIAGLTAIVQPTTYPRVRTLGLNGRIN
jgi:hypothetical protein